MLTVQLLTTLNGYTDRHRMNKVLQHTTLFLFIACVLTAFLPGQPAYAQQKEIVIEQRDGDITILPDGRVECVETWQVRFNKGRFSRVMHVIPHDYVTEITDWSVREGGHSYDQSENLDSINYEPDTYTVRTDDDATTITWYFTKTQNRSRTFTLRYTLQGALRIYPNLSDQFVWNFVEPNHPYPITSSRATVHLPESVAPDQMTAFAYHNQIRQEDAPVVDGQDITFQGGPFEPAESWMFHIQFPHGAVQSDRPSWQTEVENALVDPTNAATVTHRDYDMHIQADGTIHVTETWDMDLTGGPFSNASYDVPHSQVTDITAWQVQEGDEAYEQTTSREPGTFTVTPGDDATSIRWYFPLTTDQSRTFTLSYVLHGALAIYPDLDMFRWDIAHANRAYAIEESQVTVRFPESFDPARIQATTYLNEEEHQGNGPMIDAESIVFTGGPFDPDTSWTIETHVPHGSIAADAPPWQAQLDEQRQHKQERQQYEQTKSLAIQIAGAIVLIAVIVGAGVLWRKLPK